jgi:hypothetical protein
MSATTEERVASRPTHARLREIQPLKILRPYGPVATEVPMRRRHRSGR